MRTPRTTRRSGRALPTTARINRPTNQASTTKSQTDALTSVSYFDDHAQFHSTLHHTAAEISRLQCSGVSTECGGQTVAALETRSRNKTASREVNSLGQNLVFMVEDGVSFCIIVGYGASDNVVSEQCSPHVPTVPPKGNMEGVQYEAAEGSSMSIRGEEAARIITEEGHRRSFNMQVTDVKSPLTSSATFTTDGGTVRHLACVQETRFHRVDNVHRLKASADGEDSGFSRQRR